MNWLTKIIKRDDSAARIADAHRQREQAAEDLASTRELTSRLHEHGTRNHLTDRMRAAFLADERRRHA